MAWRVGAISQSITYPFDVVRRKMQVVGMGAAVGYQYNNAYEAVRVIIRHEGILGMYRGLWPNLRTCFLLLTHLSESYVPRSIELIALGLVG